MRRPRPETLAAFIPVHVLGRKNGVSWMDPGKSRNIPNQNVCGTFWLLAFGDVLAWREVSYPGYKSRASRLSRLVPEYPGSKFGAVLAHEFENSQLIDGDHSRTSSVASSLAAKSSIWARRRRKSCSICRVEQLPTATQITFGGAPNRNARPLKSPSLDMMTSSCCRAYSQTVGSSAVARPTVRTCTRSAQTSRSRSQRWGERFWSRSSFTCCRLPPAGAHDQPRTRGRHEYHRESDRGSLLAPRLPTCRRLGSRVRRRP